MSGTFIERKLSFEIKLGTGDYGEAGFDTVTLTGYRATATIVKIGAGGFNQAEVRIYGLDQTITNKINSLGTFFVPMGVRRNEIAISAGDAVNGMAEVFRGAISLASADFAAAPDNVFVILANVALFSALKPIPPSSYSGSVNVATIMATLADQMGMQFENNGVSVILDTPYFAGTARMQVEEAAYAANINWTIDGETGPLAIWPKGGSRGGVVPLYNSSTGMIGYPEYTTLGIKFRAVFSPGQAPATQSPGSTKVGGQIDVESKYVPATGRWVPFRITYDLAEQVPDGPWEMIMDCAFATTAQQQDKVA